MDFFTKFFENVADSSLESVLQYLAAQLHDLTYNLDWWSTLLGIACSTFVNLRLAEPIQSLGWKMLNMFWFRLPDITGPWEYVICDKGAVIEESEGAFGEKSKSARCKGTCTVSNTKLAYHNEVEVSGEREFKFEKDGVILEGRDKWNSTWAAISRDKTSFCMTYQLKHEPLKGDGYVLLETFVKLDVHSKRRFPRNIVPTKALTMSGTNSILTPQLDDDNRINSGEADIYFKRPVGYLKNSGLIGTCLMAVILAMLFWLLSHPSSYIAPFIQKISDWLGLLRGFASSNIESFWSNPIISAIVRFVTPSRVLKTLIVTGFASFLPNFLSAFVSARGHDKSRKIDNKLHGNWIYFVQKSREETTIVCAGSCLIVAKPTIRGEFIIRGTRVIGACDEGCSWEADWAGVLTERDKLRAKYHINTSPPTPFYFEVSISEGNSKGVTMEGSTTKLGRVDGSKEGSRPLGRHSRLVFKKISNEATDQEIHESKLLKQIREMFPPGVRITFLSEKADHHSDGNGYVIRSSRENAAGIGVPY